MCVYTPHTTKDNGLNRNKSDLMVRFSSCSLFTQITRHIRYTVVYRADVE